MGVNLLSYTWEFVPFVGVTLGLVASRLTRRASINLGGQHLTREEAVRANNALFDQYKQEKTKQFLHFFLNRCGQTGTTELACKRLLPKMEICRIGTSKDAFMEFGDKPPQLLAAFKQLQHQLYHVS
ncbi:type I restriction-modification enzyme R subunit C-terminal domain-containing protein [Thalassospira alkalitolerans]|uniref:type I restriction-modification enzyme R subunit C-terminal domain-containing protein n=1 Tax=Thalassospira alkalitolerans TaxID=1293890 RepID=UPI003AA7F4A2